ncbi:hypothetical protein FJ970_09070 [Mesorhizobium sp. B2-1-8]|uniref:hypothetical protein n=1 Tax=Mesorhizobium sp. B2-1-8 TaxID=2589967 RepID=UPI0011267CC9|nr:hypothetical protein [Mesorhizobium sp. B2-1-8]UCI21082.1 hypothetical protein FJ970_09070 [Mesorhizobium sp. B2-1-8]
MASREAGWAFAGGVIGAVVGAIATVWTGAFGYWNKNRELDIEMVRVSLSILAGENKDTSLPGRKFALRALSRYSGVEIPDEEFDKWASTGTVPPSLESWWRPVKPSHGASTDY